MKALVPAHGWWGAAGVVVVGVIVAAGCGRNEPGSLRTTGMQIGNARFTLEVADTYAKRARGLMQRDSMASDHGMIFVFDKEQDLAFWMHNTRIPLDIVYLDATGRIVSVASMKPYDETSVPSGAPAKYAIELNQGAAQLAGIKAGDVLVLPPDVRP
jgi:uncharacterized membrane protein (UPF0127 family)